MNRKTRQLVYEKFNGHCAYCGCELEMKDMQVDHIKPLCRGYSIQLLSRIGKDEMENYNPSCRACNFRKGMLTIDEFRAELQKGVERLEKDFTFRMMVKYNQIKENVSPITFYFEGLNDG